MPSFKTDLKKKKTDLTGANDMVQQVKLLSAACVCFTGTQVQAPTVPLPIQPPSKAPGRAATEGLSAWGPTPIQEEQMKLLSSGVSVATEAIWGIKSEPRDGRSLCNSEFKII